MREDPAYLSQQLLTYLGNKRALLGLIGEGVARVRQRLGGRLLRSADLFTGSGVVARALRSHSQSLVVNDLETYAAVTARCYQASPDPVMRERLADAHAQLQHHLEHHGLQPGLIARLYAPADDTQIQPGERVFFTTRNARYLDTVRTWLASQPLDLHDFLLAPLLAQASVHANTSGVFKGFYKDAATGVGQFGGTGRQALQRIRRDMELPLPVWSRFDVPCEVHKRDANELAPTLPELDLAYLDPPYNQHPYGANYFLLNLLVDYREPVAPSRVSGIPRDWQRSVYNRRAAAQQALAQLVADVPARFLLVSSNSQGFLGPDVLHKLLAQVGRVEVLETRYNAFRGSRNLRQRALHVQEYLFLVEKVR